MGVGVSGTIRYDDMYEVPSSTEIEAKLRKREEDGRFKPSQSKGPSDAVGSAVGQIWSFDKLFRIPGTDGQWGRGDAAKEEDERG